MRKKILPGFAAVIVVLLIAELQSEHFRISRSAVIAAPPAAGLFMHCDRMVGGKFEKGFENLKAIVAPPGKQ